MFCQEDQNRGKPNWEHLNDELHVLITCEDAENRAQMKIQRAIDEVRKLLTVVRKSVEYQIPVISHDRQKKCSRFVQFSNLNYSKID